MDFVLAIANFQGLQARYNMRPIEAKPRPRIFTEAQKRGYYKLYPFTMTAGQTLH